MPHTPIPRSYLSGFFFMGSFPTAVQQEFLYQEEPVVRASVCYLSGLGFRALGLRAF